MQAVKDNEVKVSRFVESYVAAMDGFGDAERLEFYEDFAKNMALTMHEMCGDNKISDPEKLESIKWMSNIMYHIMHKITVMRLDSFKWGEKGFAQLINTYFYKSPSIYERVLAAINVSINSDE